MTKLEWVKLVAVREGERKRRDEERQAMLIALEVWERELEGVMG